METAEEIKDQAQETVEEVKCEVQETAQEVKDEAQETANCLKNKVQEVLDKTDIDEKVVEGAKGLLGKIGGLFKGKE